MVPPTTWPERCLQGCPSWTKTMPSTYNQVHKQASTCSGDDVSHHTSASRVCKLRKSVITVCSMLFLQGSAFEQKKRGFAQVPGLASLSNNRRMHQPKSTVSSLRRRKKVQIGFCVVTHRSAKKLRGQGREDALIPQKR